MKPSNKKFCPLKKTSPSVEETSKPEPIKETDRPAGQQIPSEKIKQIQKELGVTADGIIGPITIGAAKNAIADSRTYSQAVGLADRYELILNVDTYRTQTKTVSAPSAPPTQKEKIAEAVDIFTTTLFPPTAVAKALTGNQTIGPEEPTSQDMAGE